MDYQQILFGLLCCMLCFNKRSLAIKCFVCSPDFKKGINCVKISTEHIVDCPNADEKQCYALMAGAGDADGSVQRDCGPPPMLAFVSGSMGTGCRVIGGTSTVCSCSTDLCNDVGDREEAEVLREQVLPEYKSDREPMPKLQQTASQQQQQPQPDQTLAIEPAKDSATTKFVVPSTVLVLSFFLVALLNSDFSSSTFYSSLLLPNLPYTPRRSRSEAVVPPFCFARQPNDAENHPRLSVESAGS